LSIIRKYNETIIDKRYLWYYRKIVAAPLLSAKGSSETRSVFSNYLPVFSRLGTASSVAVGMPPLPLLLLLLLLPLLLLLLPSAAAAAAVATLLLL
jgi:hypothetical protein